jgi:hypothetical protein
MQLKLLVGELPRIRDSYLLEILLFLQVGFRGTMTGSTISFLISTLTGQQQVMSGYLLILHLVMVQV